ncbi:TPA: translation initiation factor IF-2 [Klebsiella pneumoniae]|uniref:Gp138 family membrane-puncturing spike protein n=1 Tax=Klebsiella/Raoultella group TaxID=2890311 RepID=UPI000950171D|nr:MULTISPECIES: Gp138 family membrane-puncturing spike protein [Klebsiella/Raoultella group]EFP2386452.1 translation initiation factor IF-2 [Escherichia coli]HBQ8858133.1 translation initiation factor IF-2 [Klebsiella variicola subsp. variicola]HCM5755858.1 translation initiation factor IF-2 [Klebsiella quasipneumoniae]EKJ7338004.1 translation initiation factor IF-2 [Klebsiella pneumoniae]EKT9788286.1 translation initiation factor IF-2 [Klebsiella pneumoniae]
MAILRPVSSNEVNDVIMKSVKKTLRVAMPGVIQSFDPENLTCVVEISVFSVKPEGKSVDRLDVDNVFYPLILDAPVIFPRGGGVTLTFPVKEGDECLVVFADRCIDFWWQNGNVQNGSRGRMHDYSDAFVIPGPQSQAKKISGISTTAAQLRTDDGSAFIEIASNGAVTINSPQTIVNGPFHVNGDITSTGDQTAAGISQVNHTHGGVESGGSSTGKPE